MSVQVSVRLDESVVAELDALVRSGGARSRAEVVESALERELRRRLYERDAAVLAQGPGDADLDGLVAWLADHPSHLD